MKRGSRRLPCRSVLCFTGSLRPIHDIDQLRGLRRERVERGYTVVVSEQDPDAIETVLRVIDHGGEIIATGTPEQVARYERSHAERFRARLFGVARKAA